MYQQVWWPQKTFRNTLYKIHVIALVHPFLTIIEHIQQAFIKQSLFCYKYLQTHGNYMSSCFALILLFSTLRYVYKKKNIVLCKFLNNTENHRKTDIQYDSASSVKAIQKEKNFCHNPTDNFQKGSVVKQLFYFVFGKFKFF